MSPRSAHTIVLLTGALMFAAVFLRRSSIPDPFRFAWAAGVITVGLSVLADLAPEIAGPFALLVLIAVYTRNRQALSGIAPTAATTQTAAASPQPGPGGFAAGSPTHTGGTA